MVIGYNKHMFIVGILSWWYSTGWIARVFAVKNQLVRTYDYFSIGLLASSLFAPYRQISAGGVKGPVSVMLRAFFDRQLSRVIGAVARTILIVIGLVWIAVQVTIGVLTIIGWSMLPFAPLAGFILMVSGWVPSWR